MRISIQTTLFFPSGDEIVTRDVSTESGANVSLINSNGQTSSQSTIVKVVASIEIKNTPAGNEPVKDKNDGNESDEITVHLTIPKGNWLSSNKLGLETLIQLLISQEPRLI